MNQSELEANTCHRRQARENACEQVAIGLSFTSDWWRKWREIFQPITERSKAKPKQNQSKTQITFDTQMKTALSWVNKDTLLCKLNKITVHSHNILFFQTKMPRHHHSDFTAIATLFILGNVV